MVVHLNEGEAKRTTPFVFCRLHSILYDEKEIQNAQAWGVDHFSSFEVAAVKLASKREFVVRATAIVHLMNS